MAELDGDTQIPLSAEQVWSAAFPKTPGDLPQILALKLEGLEFSRYPAEPALQIKGNVIEGHTVAIVFLCNGVIFEGEAGEDQLFYGDCWYAISRAEKAAVEAILHDVGVTNRGAVPLAAVLKLRAFRDDGVEILDATQSASAAQVASATMIPVSAKLRGTPYPYQRDGAAFLSLVSDQGLGCILGDEMGLGKTLQVIMFLLNEHDAGRRAFLIVCPATLLENWRRELAIFAPSLTVGTHAGPGRAGSSTSLLQYDVVITSLETAVRDEPMLSDIEWAVLVVDEGQSIKNPAAQRTLSLKRLRRRISIAVTGTPVENALSDLWSLSDFALPGLLGSIDQFRSSFTDSPEDASRLAPIVAPILLRRRVAEVAADLPPKIDVPQAMVLTESLASEYERIRTETLGRYRGGGGLVAIQLLRQFCANVQAGVPDNPEPTPKTLRLLELMEEIFSQGEKALVFAPFHRTTDQLLEVINRRFPFAFTGFIDGRVPVPGRQPIVDRFSAHPGYGALILNAKAAGTGLNITAANHVVHFCPEWNPAVQDQATARAYRRRQTRPVTVVHLFYSGTVEQVMIDRLQLKRELAGEATTGNSGGSDAADLLRALSISPVSKSDEVYKW